MVDAALSLKARLPSDLATPVTQCHLMRSSELGNRNERDDWGDTADTMNQNGA